MLIPFGLIILLELCLRPFFCNSAYIIVTDWANDAVYICLFIFGFLFASDGRIAQRFQSYDRLAKILAAFALGMLFSVNIQSQVFYRDGDYLTVLWAIFKGVYESAMIVFLINLGGRRWNKDSRALRYLSQASFPIYILHFLPVSFFPDLDSNGHAGFPEISTYHSLFLRNRISPLRMLAQNPASSAPQEKRAA